MNTNAQTPAELADIWDKNHISKIFPSNVRHKDVKKYLEQLKAMGLKVDEVGRSVQMREIYQVEYGKGPLKVFLWSQMHGDEPTATSSLIDMFAYLQKHKDEPWVKKLSETMTIRAVPMLNPDGAEVYLRRNAMGIDINRDAVDLKTPEAQLLKRLRDEWMPEIGFNLHNQQALTTAGYSNRQAAISFLVVYGDPEKTTSEGHERNKRLSSAMVLALENYIRGYIGRYGDEWTPTAFGDNFSAWGTPTILIETGALHGKDEMYLVKMNFIAILTALTSVSNGTEKNFVGTNYETLPHNTSGRIYHVVFRNATIVDRAAILTPEKMMTIGDIAVNFDRRRAEMTAPAYIRQIGTVAASGLDEFDAGAYNVVGRFGGAKVGQFSELLFYKKGRAIDWASTDLEKQFPPDAIFSTGKWVKGEELFKKK